VRAGGFNESSVAGICAASSGDGSGKGRFAVGPDGNVAACAGRNSIRVDGDIGFDGSSRGILFGTSAMKVAADEDGATTGIAGSVDSRAIEKADLVPEDFDGAAGRTGIYTGCLQRAAIRDDAGAAAV
jgi:hypothetical protein